MINNSGIIDLNRCKDSQELSCKAQSKGSIFEVKKIQAYTISTSNTTLCYVCYPPTSSFIENTSFKIQSLKYEVTYQSFSRPYHLICPQVSICFNNYAYIQCI